MCLLSPGARTVSWAKDVNSKISTALIYVSPPYRETVSAPFQDQFDNFPFPASSEKLRMEASQAIGSANSTVIFGVLVLLDSTVIFGILVLLDLIVIFQEIISFNF